MLRGMAFGEGGVLVGRKGQVEIGMQHTSASGEDSSFQGEVMKESRWTDFSVMLFCSLEAGV